MGAMGTKQLLHNAQMGFAGIFQQYDYGSQNLEFYGQDHPPAIDLSSITSDVPMSFYVGEDDSVSTVSHSRKLFKLFGPEIVFSYNEL